MLDRARRVSHMAATLAARWGRCWCGWGGGAPVFLRPARWAARADRLLYQARLALDDALRLKVVRKMYAMRFGESRRPPQRGTVARY